MNADSPFSAVFTVSALHFQHQLQHDFARLDHNQLQHDFACLDHPQQHLIVPCLWWSSCMSATNT